MASFSAHHALIFMAFMLSSLLSLASHPDTKISTSSSSSPSSSIDPPLSSLSSLQDLSPDISPLLPSPGGVLPTPTGSDIPTIPSTPSPPNPDDIVASGPLSAFSPFGLVQATSNVPRSILSNPTMAVLAGFVAYWSMQYKRM